MPIAPEKNRKRRGKCLQVLSPPPSSLPFAAKQTRQCPANPDYGGKWANGNVGKAWRDATLAEASAASRPALGAQRGGSRGKASKPVHANQQPRRDAARSLVRSLFRPQLRSGCGSKPFTSFPPLTCSRRPHKTALPNPAFRQPRPPPFDSEAGGGGGQLLPPMAEQNPASSTSPPFPTSSRQGNPRARPLQQLQQQQQQQQLPEPKPPARPRSEGSAPSPPRRPFNVTCS